MIKIIKNTYLPNRFFWLFGVVSALFALSFFVPIIFPLIQAILILSIVLVLTDWVLIFSNIIKLKLNRYVPKLLSLGDDNKVFIVIDNYSPMSLEISVIDELPFQFQQRDFQMNFELAKGETRELTYLLRPTTRGEYNFGNINVFSQSIIGLIKRRHVFNEEYKVPVYPSIIQMKEFELKTMSRISTFQGIKKMRRLGHSYEFEQIKTYVPGDDYRSINWKATGRNSTLMVNQYEDERAQQVYTIIDKSRSMKMPFNNLSLLDYAINTSLTISNIAMRKHDKAGLITFSDKIETSIKAERKKGQLKKILDTLYKESESQLEANYELLYKSLKRFINNRSLLFLYANIESEFALKRILPVLRKINSLHLLVFVFFENSEISDYGSSDAENVKEIYLKTIARKYTNEKVQIVQKLNQHGIQTILTKPEDLSINTINKYLELKARGMI